MKIAIIGSGNVGNALGQGWLKAKHQVIFGVRDPQSSKSQKAKETSKDAVFASIEDAIRQAEVIVVTTPPEAVTEIAKLIMKGTSQVIIDTTNSIRAKPEPYATGYHALKALTETEKVVKCFNTTGFENMANPVYPSGGIDMFAAGDNKEAKVIATQLAKDLGFDNCYDFGGDDKVELLEKFALSWINLAIMQGQGRNIAFKILKR